MRRIYLYLFALLFLISACRRSHPEGNEVRVRLAQDPESLNPVSYTSKDAMQLVNLLFQSLLTVDLADGKLKPLLAAEMPLVTPQDSLTLITYQIRPEARWANGEPVTAQDVAFTLKVRKSPLVNNEKVRPDYAFITDIRVDDADPQKFTLVCKEFSPEHLLLSGDFFVLPAYLFDPEQLLAPFSLPQLDEKFDSLVGNARIQQFADFFNSARFTRDPEYLSGSAGYALKKWNTAQELIFERKNNWWGNKLQQATQLTANPEKISFQVKSDDAAALVALKNNQLDVWQNIPATLFSQLRADPEISSQFQFFTPQTYAFNYLGVNSRLDKLADKLTRQALAHLLDKDAIIKLTQQDLATRTIGLVSPEDKANYNVTIKPYPYAVDKAVALLKKAGWQKNGSVWQRKTEGELLPLTLSLKYNASNSEFESIALIFQQAAAKAGIPVTLVPLEGGVFTKDLKQGDFELFLRSMTGNPFVFNFKPILHTTSIGPDGLNYTGFGTKESDALIDELYNSHTEPHKARLLKRLQEIMHEESSLIFLFFKRDRIAVHRRFTNLKISGIKPGYDVSAFRLKAK